MTENALMVRGTALMPAMSIGDAVTRRRQLVTFTQQIMVRDVDFGKVQGTDKDTLFKPGAEKLTTFFGLSPHYEIIREVEQWDGAEPMFYYMIRCRLYHGDLFVGEADGSCNSRESRYRWRWVPEHEVSPALSLSTLKRRGGKVTEPKFAVERGQTQGKYGKPDEYWQTFRDAIEAGTAKETTRTSQQGRVMPSWEIDMVSYRVPNEDIFSLVNTVLKMAEKRALVAAVLVAVNASEFFTQDMEDLDASLIDVTPKVTVVESVPAGPPNIDYGGQPLDSESPEPPKNETPKEPPTAKRSWPSEIIKPLVEANLARNFPNAVRMLNLSNVLRTTDELEFVMAWAVAYRGQRPGGPDDKEPEDAAKWADAQMPKGKGE